MVWFNRKKPAAKKGGAVSKDAPPSVVTKPDGTLSDSEGARIDGSASSSETALVPASKPKARRTRQPPVLKPNTSADCASNPITAEEGAPKLKCFSLDEQPVERGYRLIESILCERESGALKTVFSSISRMSHRRVVVTSILSGLVSSAIFTMLGPVGLLAVPAAFITDRVRESHRVRGGRHGERNRVSESDALRISPAALAMSSQDKSAWPWELRCQWLLAAWRLQILVRNYNMRATVVNAALRDGTMSPAEHTAALRMGDLLRKEYPRLESIKRFLQDDVYGGQKLERPMSEMAQYDKDVIDADLFGYRDNRRTPIEWLILPHRAFTRKHLLHQLHVDLETIAGLRLGIREADRDGVDLKIGRLEQGVRTGRSKKLPPPNRRVTAASLRKRSFLLTGPFLKRTLPLP